jgi:diadenosine tetraphosphatase ApaH/serine/threonine PP2A family protein phosphatase
MRYAIFTDIHANLEALEAVLAKIDELAQQEPIDQIWFLGDLVGYGPNPNECITTLRKRTDIIIAGNHDWAAVGKIDLNDFSAAARISAEWTAEQLTEEHRDFLANLPERIVLRDCTLVHGSPYGPLWEYLTSEALAERSFQYFTSRFCFVGHTHVPVIFQQPDTITQTPTAPLSETEQQEEAIFSDKDTAMLDEDDEEETQKVVAIRPAQQTMQDVAHTEEALIESELSATTGKQLAQELPESSVNRVEEHVDLVETQAANGTEAQESSSNGYTNIEVITNKEDVAHEEEPTHEESIASAEERLNSEIEELLALLGLSQSMIQVTNEMLVPPEGAWTAPRDYRAIVNPGGVGQPRDGDPRAAFMIYDSEHGFTFYRIHYDYEKTQEKIIQAGLPPYLAARLGYGR